jgi:hypothetical protein
LQRTYAIVLESLEVVRHRKLHYDKTLETIYGKPKMTNVSTSLEQEKRERQELERIQEEAGLNTDRYSEGYFEGYIGCEPRHPEQHSYWSGYQIGCREYWAKKLGVEIPTEF